MSSSASCISPKERRHAEPGSSRRRVAAAVQRADRPRLSAGDHRRRSSDPALSREWQSADRQGWRADRLGADRPKLRQRQIFPWPPFGDAGAGSRSPRRFVQDDRRALQRRQFDRLQPWPDVAEAGRPGESRRRGQARRRLERANPRRRRDDLGLGARSRRFAPDCAGSGSRCRQGARAERGEVARAGRLRKSKSGRWGCLASRVSMCCG